jgi:hypothetical protein
MEEKFRIIEKKFDDHSEFHPQMLIGPFTYKPSVIKKFFGDKEVVFPERWHSILMGTIDFEHGVSSKYAAEVIIEKYRNKKFVEEIIHEVN